MSAVRGWRRTGNYSPSWHQFAQLRAVADRSMSSSQFGEFLPGHSWTSLRASRRVRTASSGVDGPQATIRKLRRHLMSCNSVGRIIQRS